MFILIYAVAVAVLLYTAAEEDSGCSLLFFIPLVGILYEIDASDKVAGITCLVAFCVWLTLLYGGMAYRKWRKPFRP